MGGDEGKRGGERKRESEKGKSGESRTAGYYDWPISRAGCQCQQGSAVDSGQQ